MSNCTRCGWTNAPGATICQRCGQTLAPAAPPPRPTLILRIDGSELPPERWEVNDTGVGIGRLETSDISLPHKSVSRQHARILPTSSGYEIEDLGSVNGTWVNDKPIADRTPLHNGDHVMIGDIQLAVELHQTAPVAQVVQVVQPPVTPQPLPPPGGGGRPPLGGPSTVFYDIDDALAAAGPQVVEPARPAVQPVRPAVQPVRPPLTPDPVEEVPTAWDVVPARPVESAPPPQVVDQPTLIAADVTIQPGPTPPPPTNAPRPAPPPNDITPLPTFEPRPAPPRDVTPLPTFEPRPAPPHDVTPVPTFEPRPAPPPDLGGPSFEPRPAPPREVTPLPTFEPRPAPPPDLGGPSFEPRPAPPRDVTPLPTFEPRPAPPPDLGGPSFEPRPAPPREAIQAPASTSTQPPAELSTVALIDLADQLATSLRLFKGDANLALWLFEHAGGEPAVHAFADQARRAQANPDDPREQAALLEWLPTATSLLEAAVLLARVVSALGGPTTGTDNETEANAPDLQPVTRA